MEYRVISTDCHINEPPDLYRDRLPAKYRAQAPRTESFGLNVVAGKAPKDFRFSGIPFEEILPGNYDGQAHLADMSEDGVDASVVYPMGALSSYAMPDRDLGLAIVRTYNDWLLDEFAIRTPTG